ncbi:uncharacterized protein SCHCODRAFT_02493704 [Schizophyllum commune H4-8]|uniref:Uncharacterized protein n=1 Tax=Schizophyllum commune (strain H4-8 / FGSC 9210) TaxID=578458 RepID=D8PXV7_SCHCM|nr:uncharacterized protein SCHCODRAFT_02493704 [Schizophyllum commune H4-8]KAI5897070.1 hypothetical protein SCHCODRAFT_02493704 [Schizophyllum commune H4-8]
MTMCETSVRPIIPRLWLLSEQKCDDIIPVEWLDVPMKVGVEIKVSGRVAKRGEDCLVMTAKNDEDIFLFFSPDFCSTLSIRDTTGRVFVIGFTFTERAMYIMRHASSDTGKYISRVGVILVLTFRDSWRGSIQGSFASRIGRKM